jgi:hypothetical protein
MAKRPQEIGRPTWAETLQRGGSSFVRIGLARLLLAEAATAERLPRRQAPVYDANCCIMVAGEAQPEASFGLGLQRLHDAMHASLVC